MGLFKKKKNKEVMLYDSEGQISDINKKEKKSKPKSNEIVLPQNDQIGFDIYYNKYSNVFGAMKIISIIILIAMILIVFLFFSKDFTAENFKYLLKHLDFNSSNSSHQFLSVMYDESGGAVFSEYRRDLVITVPRNIKIYDYKGAVSLNSSTSTDNPKLSTSSKYILLYDMYDKDYMILNNFSVLLESECIGDIISADMSDKGVYAIATESKEYASHVLVYNENFELIGEIKRNNPVLSLNVSDDGKYLAVVTILINADDGDADMMSVVDIYSTDKMEESLYSIDINGEMAGQIEFSNATDDEIFLNVITDKSLKAYSCSSQGIDSAEYQYNKGDHSLYDIGKNIFSYCYLSKTYSSDYIVTLVDLETMNEKFSYNTDSEIICIRQSESKTYILTVDRLVVVDHKEYETQSVELEDPKGIILFENENVFIRYVGRAELVNFD